MKGLSDDSRPGTPRKITDAKVEDAVTQTLESLPPAAKHWSARARRKGRAEPERGGAHLAQFRFTTPSERNVQVVHRSVAGGEGAGHRVGLYLNPPEHAIVLCVDEKSQVQASTRGEAARVSLSEDKAGRYPSLLVKTQPILPLRPGLPEQRTSDYERHGTTSLFAALDIATGQVIGECHRRHRHQDFLKFMEAVDSTLPPDAGEIHLVLDNYGTHKTPKVVRWFARHPRYQLHFTPTSGSWVNQVERWFAEITEKRIRRGSFTSVASLEKAIKEYLEYNNEHPKPFVWTADADLILGKIQRLCERISNSPKTLNARNSSMNV